VSVSFHLDLKGHSSMSMPACSFFATLCQSFCHQHIQHRFPHELHGIQNMLPLGRHFPVGDGGGVDDRYDNGDGDSGDEDFGGAGGGGGLEIGGLGCGAGVLGVVDSVNGGTPLSLFPLQEPQQLSAMNFR
jgi:hypothetical protein